jgi:hypothetical protein
MFLDFFVSFDAFCGTVDFLEFRFVLVVRLKFCFIFQKGIPLNVRIVFVGENWGRTDSVFAQVVVRSLEFGCLEGL